jgi:hypothetical protein
LPPPEAPPDVLMQNTIYAKMKIENYDISHFNLEVEKDFKESIADFAKVPFDDVHILSIKQGSIIIDFKVNFKFAYGNEDNTSITNVIDENEEENSSSSSSSSGLKESTESIDNDNTNEEKSDNYPPHLTINKSQEAFTNALRIEHPSIIFKNAKTRIMKKSQVSLVALEDLQENFIQAWRNDDESAFINVNVTDLIGENGYYNTNNITLIDEEEHQQENNSTKRTPSLVNQIESFYKVNEANVKKAGFAAVVALFLLLVYCVWKRLRRRRRQSKGGAVKLDQKRRDDENDDDNNNNNTGNEDDDKKRRSAKRESEA